MKIIKDFKLIYLFVGLLFIVSSCEDDLDTVPLDDDASTAEDFFNQDDAYKRLLAGVYGNLNLTSASDAGSSNIGGLDAGTSQYGRALMNLQTFTTDEAIWSYENDPGIAEIQRSTWTPANVIIRGAFGRIMGSVAFANEFLRQSTEAKLNSRNVSGEELQEMPAFRAEARLLRALSYYHMLDLFGKAPFVTEEDPVGVFRSEEIVGVDLFNYIESELLEAMPNLKDARTNEYARADKAVAWMILAKLYLNAEVYIGEDRYADALEYSQNIIDAGYSLTPNYQDVFRADNDVNGAQNEVIFPVPADGNFSQSFGPSTVFTNGAVGSIEENGAALGVPESGWGGAIRVTPQFVSLFNGAAFTNDTRNTIISEDRPINITDVSNRDQGYILIKFTDVRSDGTQDDNLDISSVDFPMFRLADVYLMYAEAHLRGGGGSRAQAVEYVNLIRTRAQNGSTTWNISDSDLTLDFIIDERARELYWESHRRQDLRRFGLFTGASYVWTLKGNSLSGIPIADFRGLFPIPSESMSANPNLTQNPGY
ncbi:RagB/SusD family nutrient uptake outer membrane protein [Flavobacteriaceae bacterium 14752]|uniref:RagB/SusD family nutrient uptake outer membrane protein n=1 Tax=Mesohalobacter salilacus TaxID=2491711 RepID=UPI000F63F0AC|nr:RagB/SusD family nutrient uptake outer membrane protein [Flavobacteriaceae bacterium 14752]